MNKCVIKREYKIVHSGLDGEWIVLDKYQSRDEHDNIYTMCVLQNPDDTQTIRRVPIGWIKKVK